MTDSLLEVKGLKTHFLGGEGKVKAVDGVDFTVNEGETVGIVGESGSGKSITCLSIMRLLKDTTGRTVDGSIKFSGNNLLELSERDMRSIRGNDIAMVFQEPMTSLNPVIRIGKQLEESIKLHLRFNNKDAKNHAIKMLKSVGIPRAEKIIYEFPHQLSGGMRQRVMIAMAMSCKPKLLIADEPTTALDVTIQAQILELMKKLKKEEKTAIMLITHDLGVVAEMCEKVVVMYAGKVVETGSVFEIFDNPKHPYTKGLIHSVPKLRQKIKRLNSIPGSVPRPSDMPRGCKFAPRCSEVMNICWHQEPELIDLTGNHQSRCWLHQDNVKGGEENEYPVSQS